MYCVECDQPIDKRVYYYSTENFGFALCRNHQEWLRNYDLKITLDAKLLYLALKDRNVPAELEKYDGHKTVDIVIEEARVHLEIDGMQHNYDPRQARADLRRTYHSFKNGYFTLRIPNSLIRDDLDDTADWIVDLLILGRKKAAKKSFSFFKLFQ
jgi:very-short-patch-repair endonuclease